jgi:hypothetical protein
MQIVELRIEFGCARNRCAAKYNGFAGSFRSLRYVTNLRCLDVHAADEDEVGPTKIGFGGLRDIFIDEPNWP